jgi:hypothetical protein
LIDKNLRRQAWQVSNFMLGGGDIVYSFDSPKQVGITAGGVPIFAGISLAIGESDEETNGSVTINDIWVTCNDSTATFPIFVLGYEGILSLAGNAQ